MNKYRSRNSKHNSALTPLAKNLRKEMTKEERHLWYDFLRSYPIRFLRQKVIDRYIVDFYCHDARLIIEIDGSQHYLLSGLIKDQIRTQHIESRNLKVIRIPNNLIFSHFREICEYINMTVIQQIGYDPWDKDPPCHLKVTSPFSQGGRYSTHSKGAVKIEQETEKRR